MRTILRATLLAVASVAILRSGVLHRVPWPREMPDNWHAFAQSGVQTLHQRTAEIERGGDRKLLRHRLEQALEQYRFALGAQPTSLEDLVRSGLLQRDDLADEWGRALGFELREGCAVVRGAGFDGIWDTPDDWIVSR